MPKVANWRTVPSRLYGFAGQPGRVTTVLPLRICGTPVAPVGFGAADGTPPHEAHEPIAMIAPALAATSCSVSIAFLPPTWQ